tara:strand:- start:3531 stop:4241 length:711 start_codon:yes stop_codon:yes gene_type:complete
MKFLIQFKTIILALALSISAARAEVMEVWSHSLENGDYAKNVKQYERLRPILQNLGAYVEYYLEDIDGAPVSHFVVKFDDLRIWGAYRDRLGGDPDFQKWNSRFRAKANAIQLNTALMNNIYEPEAKADLYRGTSLFYISQWKALPGQTLELQDILIEAAKTAENNGIFAQVYANGYDDTYMVVWAFDSYTTAATQWSFVHDSPEYQRFFQKAVKSKAGVFVDQSWMNKTMPYEGY